jgi:hypothetical protein
MIMIATLALLFCGQGAALRPVPFTQVKLTDGFFAPRLATNRQVTIPACLDRCEETKRIENFAVAAKLRPGKHEGALYNDSDVYKVLEGAAYALSEKRDSKLEARVDGVIELIAAAQQPNGYLNTFITLTAPEKRWKNVRHGHELYCAGHLIEAAVAYDAATGKRKLLDVALRLAGCIEKEFGWKKHQEPTGHPELELALVKLARHTGERRWAELAKFFVDVRGKKDRGTELFGEYAQDHLPVREQKQIVGHAVRAMYLYCGMADLAEYFGDKTLSAPLDALWHDVTDTRMYLTGGIGNSAANEGFTVPYELPNDTAYCETCAGIGLSLWAHRMFLATGDPKYIDVLERASYNNVLSGVSLSGDKFFYDNVLATDGGAQRVAWFDCSCCPTNVARFLPAMGERIYATDGESLDVCLFVDSEADLVIRGTKVHVKQETKYPYDGALKLTLKPERPLEFAVRVRVPGWCSSISERSPGHFSANFAPQGPGWRSFARDWSREPTIDVEFGLPVRRTHADPRVAADQGRVALERGPLVYAFEGVDNGGDLKALVMPAEARAEASALFGGCQAIRAGKWLAIPYCFWSNRTPGPMQVWIPESEELAKRAADKTILGEGGVKLSASHCWHTDTVAAIADGKCPTSSHDESIPRLTFWDHRGSKEWLEMDFPEARAVQGARVYWFDDTGSGSCRLPKSWRLLARDGDTWKPIEAGYPVTKDGWSDARFPTLTTSALRLEVELAPGVSGGVLEWQPE